MLKPTAFSLLLTQNLKLFYIIQVLFVTAPIYDRYIILGNNLDWYKLLFTLNQTDQIISAMKGSFDVLLKKKNNKIFQT